MKKNNVIEDYIKKNTEVPHTIPALEILKSEPKPKKRIGMRLVISSLAIVFLVLSSITIVDKVANKTDTVNISNVKKYLVTTEVKRLYDYRVEPATKTAYNAFAKDIILAASNGNVHNFNISIPDIYVSLALTARLSNGKAQEELLKVLHVEDALTLDIITQDLVSALGSGDNGYIISNVIVKNATIAISSSLLKIINNNYYANIFNFDADSSISEIIKSNITANIPADYLSIFNDLNIPDLDSDLAIYSSFFTKTGWTRFYSFNAEKTPKPKQFNDVVNAYFHSFIGTGSCVFAEDGYDFNALYFNQLEKGTLIFAMPVAGKSIPAIRTNVVENNFTSRTARFELTVPIFKVNNTLDLTDSLKSLGIANLFSPYKGTVRNLLDSDEFYCKKVIQASLFGFNRYGVEAGSVTVEYMAGSAVPPPEKLILNLNHSFIYQYEINGLTICYGEVYSPLTYNPYN